MDTFVTTTARIRGPDRLIVNELFGPTFQGEGPSAGRRAGFVRLGRCDLSCRWCDTPYTWDWTGSNGIAFDPARELTERAVVDVVDRITEMDVPLVVITGGEPLLQRRSVTRLVRAFVDRGLDVEIETNGRHRPLAVEGPVVHNVSPKLTSSELPESRRLRWDRLEELAADRSVFKFVCSSTEDLDEVAVIVARVPIDAARVWISPLGTTIETVNETVRRLADQVLARGWNLSSRLHVVAWGDERGR